MKELILMESRREMWRGHGRMSLKCVWLWGSGMRPLLCFVFPGLPSHPQHELAKRQCTGLPGMVSFYIKGALRHAETFLKSLKVSSTFIP